MKQRTLTLQKIYKEGMKRLADAQIAEAGLDAWELLEYVTGISRTMYYADPSAPVSEENEKRYFDCITKRAKRIPLQHITGVQGFMGYTFHVNEHVLIPRQETEVLVEEALERLKNGMRILDMCTGSGCILLSLMKMGEERKHIQDLTGTGVDISEEALLVARENAKLLGVSAEFRKSDLFSEVTGTYDILVSNPPYIPTKVIEGLEEEVRLHDPYIALDGKEDGLYFYRRIISDSAKHMKPGGILMLEIGHDQGEAVKAMLLDAGYRDVKIKKDLAGLDRVAVAM